MLIYTCPIHPEVEREQSENCPKCGTKLAPKQDGEATGPQTTRRRSLLWRWQ